MNERQKIIIGTLIKDPSLIMTARKYISPICLEDPFNEIFSLLVERDDRFKEITPSILLAELPNIKTDVWGLLWKINEPETLEEHCIKIKEEYNNKTLKKALNDVIARMQVQKLEWTQALDELKMTEEHLVGLIDSDDGKQEALARLAVKANTPIKDGLIGIDTGYRCLNDMLGGWEEGKYIVIGGRPGMGKTDALINFGLNIALSGEPFGLVSLEMTEDELYHRANSILSTIDRSINKWGDGIAERYTNKLKTLSNLPFFVCDLTKVGNTIPAISMKVREWIKTKNIKFFGLDYLQLLNVPGSSRYEKVTEASLALSYLIKSTKTTGFICTQLNRETEKNANARPTLANLKESGAIEQDANMIFFPYRPAYYSDEDDFGNPIGNELDLDLLKNRGGRTMRFKLFYDSPSGKIYEGSLNDYQSNGVLVGAKGDTNDDIPF